jgi:FKBP-type peptidyl-prolyl cis-trans isomerase
MKSYFIFVFAIIASDALAQQSVDLSDHNQKVNYAFGMDIVSTFQQENFNIDMNAFIAGMEDSLAGKPALTPEQKKAAIEQLQAYLQKEEMAMRKVAAAKDLQQSEVFLADNAKKDGVKTQEVVAADGSNAELQYKILQSGPAGPSPKKGDIVEVHYVGSLIDGSVFDSSIKRGFPATFGVTDVIPGWAAALQKMKVGDKWELFIPPKLAYGEFGPPQIPPNSTLIFELQLLSFYTPTNTPVATPK